MLGRGRNAIPGGKVSSLEAPRLGRRHLAGDPGILARAFDDASPAWIARHVEHRRKSKRHAVLRRLLGGDARRLLPEIRRELARFRQGDGKDRVVAMDHIEAHEQGNAEAGFLHREPLDGARLVHPPEVEQVSNPPGSDPLLQVAKFAGAGDHAGRSDHIELPDLFLERHRGEQRIDASHALASILSARADVRGSRSSPDRKQASQAASLDATLALSLRTPAKTTSPDHARIGVRGRVNSMAEQSQGTIKGRRQHRQRFAKKSVLRRHLDGFGILGFAPAQQAPGPGRRARRGRRGHGLHADQAQFLEPPILQCPDQQGHARLSSTQLGSSAKSPAYCSFSTWCRCGSIRAPRSSCARAW